MKYFAIILLLVFSPIQANQENQANESSAQNQEVFSKPLVERYVLEELRQLRIENQKLREEVIEKIANNKVFATDKAIEYTADTTSVLFYIITIAASLLVLFGWRSLQDVKNSVGSIISDKLTKITNTYEERLNEMEGKIKRRSAEIISNQEAIAKTNLVHSLWMRAGFEKSTRERIALYDQILEEKNNDVEALTYKADALLDMKKPQQALELTILATQLDEEYALGFWQRACAKAELEDEDGAIEDIKKAVSLSNPLAKKIQDEEYFEKLKNNKSLQEFIDFSPADNNNS